MKQADQRALHVAHSRFRINNGEQAGRTRTDESKNFVNRRASGIANY
jgi:hypothetical protein